ncbi:ComF family protein [Sedimentibacter acidaminivorans]|uniref:ComF family protein n=1 Tax=Sedimentibacter acidaminivorans TaxID=913099 RepID=A0ABS4GEW0_9FIRM|nr:ComF family protein [Sedimentibacter acidaminivorans]
MNSYIESLLELIYPEKNICYICDYYDESIGENYICNKCRQSIKKVVPPLCNKCGKPINYGLSINLCPDCFNFEKYFETSRSPFLYEGIIKNGIYNFKYYNKPYYYKLFGSLLLQYMNKINYLNFNYIVSVPLHRSKLKSRGYNQSELLAIYISNKLNIPYINALKRIKKTNKQSSQSKLNRMRNLENSFTINKKNKINFIKKSSVLLVDDVYTTGSTANECSKALLNYGVNKVYVITIAR